MRSQVDRVKLSRMAWRVLLLESMGVGEQALPLWILLGGLDGMVLDLEDMTVNRSWSSYHCLEMLNLDLTSSCVRVAQMLIQDNGGKRGG
jgi:hypothetical protein